ncbi:MULTISPECIES: hypothetical protein [unclassified Streptomyces]|nr:MULTISPECIES: hypothetical protein [unclassified Streptomyces]WSA93074.1 hypothetical protein OIE63_16960 [Streptomyces sp. NBC_01795]WSB77443.1 hypothetical protein OHB04_17790 [Streptomyces sp. NBC_01775]WSS14291.1 hypothetical protein OG533_22175 [Streptomyces sp. NBC_01186]WSS43109.1 hypothetical protein OG220_22855 [Streptomyces sp. NBC_01187]
MSTRTRTVPGCAVAVPLNASERHVVAVIVALPEMRHKLTV